MLGFDAAMKGLNVLEDFHNTIPELCRFGYISNWFACVLGFFLDLLETAIHIPLGS